MSDGELINTADMKAVHGAFRSTLSKAPALVETAAAGDTERAGLVANFYDNVLDFLEVHHEGEDEIIWPALLERCPEEVDHVRRIAAQHDDVKELVATSRRQLADWSVSADPAVGAQAGATLVELHTTLVSHLDEEEAEILPLCAANMTAEEWAQLPVHGFTHFGGDKPFLVLGLILQQLGDNAPYMLAEMPPPARDMWTNFGRAAFEGISTQLGDPGAPHA